MQDFFEKHNLNSNDMIGRKHATCISCGRSKRVNTPKMEPYGKSNDIVFVNNSPSKEDDKKRKPWKSNTGRNFQNLLKEMDFKLYKDAVTTHAINCYTPKAETNNILCCKPKLEKTIKKLNPKVIILLGNLPLQQVLQGKWKKGLGQNPINKWRGFQIPDRELNAYVCPIYHPGFLFHEDDEDRQTMIKRIFKQDLADAIACVNKPRPNNVLLNDERGIQYIQNDNDFRAIIRRIKQSKLIAFDYETTGLKPHSEGQKLICTAVAYTGLDSAVWMNTPERNKTFKKILRDRKIKKSAHNLMFEEAWSKIHIGKVRGWYWCTMNTHHILDQRSGITGLKFLVYTNFGVADYDSDVSPYLKSDSKKYGGNGINKIEEYIKKFGEKKVMKYCALDALYGYKLTTLQIKEINDAEDIPY